jgi:hypothetical protein
MKYFLLLVLIASTYAKDTTWTFKNMNHLNMRNAKVDSLPFDWFVGTKLNIDSDTSWVEGFLTVELSKERDNGDAYHEFLFRSGYSYGHIEYREDTEIDVFTRSVAVYYPAYIFKFGAVVTKEFDLVEWDMYIQAKTSWLYAEISFFEEVKRAYIGLSPYYEYEVGSEGEVVLRIPLGFEVKLIWEPDEHRNIVLKGYEVGYGLGLTF